MTVTTNFPKKKHFLPENSFFLVDFVSDIFVVGFFSETALVQNILQLGVNFGVKSFWEKIIYFEAFLFKMFTTIAKLIIAPPRCFVD